MPARTTPPEVALKTYETDIRRTPYIPINDNDGEYVEVDYDRDHALNFNEVDDIAFSIKENIEEGFKYELTITFDRKIHTYASMLNIEKFLKIIKYYVEETLDNSIQGWYYCKEYHRQTMGPLNRRPPHYHMLLITEDEIEPCSLWNMNKAFNRHFGMNTFRPVENLDRYIEYLKKDVLHNTKTRRRPHIFRVH